MGKKVIKWDTAKGASNEKKILGGTTNPARWAAFFNIPFRQAWGRGALRAALQSLMALKWTIHGKKCPKIVSQIVHFLPSVRGLLEGCQGNLSCQLNLLSNLTASFRTSQFKVLKKCLEFIKTQQNFYQIFIKQCSVPCWVTGGEIWQEMKGDQRWKVTGGERRPEAKGDQRWKVTRGER